MRSVKVIRETGSTAGGRLRTVRATLWVTVLALLAGTLFPFLPHPGSAGQALAGTEAPVFESADYAIKDGTGPTVVGGVAYLFAGEDPWEPPGVNSKVVALDASDGHLLWEKELEWAGGMGSKARPLVEGERLYIGCGKDVYCLETADGDVVWTRDITPSGRELGDSVIITDPVTYVNAAGTAVVVVGDYTYGGYLGLKAEDGSVLWRYPMDANTSAIGSPGVDDTADRLYLPQHTAYGSPVNGKVVCLDVSGSRPEKKWEYATEFDVAGGIALHQGKLYFSDFAYGSDMSKLYCLEDKGNEARLAWKKDIWGSSGTPLVNVNSDAVYVCGNDYSVGGNHFYAFNLSTGELIWDNCNWGAYNGNCALSPVTGYLYAGSFDTAAWAHDKGFAALDPYTGSELWSVSAKGGGDPVVAGGLVYTTANGKLYAYREYSPSSFDWYFAEGYTGDGFEQWLCLANPGKPGEEKAKVSVTYVFNGEREPLTVRYEVPAGTRVTVFVNGEVGPDMEVSMKVESDRPIVAERPVYFEYSGRSGRRWTGGHCVVGVDAPAAEWYFAEGHTGDGFEEWLTLANFEEREAKVEVTYLYPDDEPRRVEHRLPARKRATLYVNEEAGEKGDVSVLVQSDLPIVAERPVYFHYAGRGGHGWTGGHCVAGALQSSRKWYFAEGCTGDGFEEWLTLANPQDEAAKVKVTYLYQEGEPLTREYDLKGNSRHTLFVNEEAGAGKELGMVVDSSLPIVAERPLYFRYGSGWDGGSCVVGAPLLGNFWCLAEGYTSAFFDQYICVSNPGKERARVTVTPLFGDGAPFELEVEAGRRGTITLRSEEPVERAYALYSDRGVVVERAMYFNYQGVGAHDWDGGHCVMGATLQDIY